MRKIKKLRQCNYEGDERIFRPDGQDTTSLEKIDIYPDELEAVRLCDYEGKNQADVADSMRVSRGTVQRLLTAGRKKIIQGIMENKILHFKNEGNYSLDVNKKLLGLKDTKGRLKIAFPTSDGQTVETHFGKAVKFLVLVIEDGKYVEWDVIKVPANLPGRYPVFLKSQKVNLVVAYSIGDKALELLQDFGIDVELEVHGDIFEFIDMYRKGQI